MSNCDININQNLKGDIEKILNAKNVLYDKILSKLEEKAMEDHKVMTGGSNVMIQTDSIKILGKYQMKNSNNDLVNRLNKVHTRQMNLSQAGEFSFNNIRQHM